MHRVTEKEREVVTHSHTHTLTHTHSLTHDFGALVYIESFFSLALHIYMYVYA